MCRLFKVLVLSGFAAALSTFAQASCEEKYQFDIVVKMTEQALLDGSPLNAIQRQSLENSLARLPESRVLQVLETENLLVHRSFLFQTLADLNGISRSGQKGSVPLSAAQMRKAASIFDEICRSDTQMEGSEEVSQLRHVLDEMTFNAFDPLASGSAPDTRSYINLTLLFFFLLGLISCIVLVWKATAIFFSSSFGRQFQKMKTQKTPAL